MKRTHLKAKRMACEKVKILSMEVAKIHAQHWLRFLTCYFAFWPLCNLCPLIPCRVPPTVLRRRSWGLCFLWPAALLWLSDTLCAAAGFIDKRITHPGSTASGLVDVIIIHHHQHHQHHHYHHHLGGAGLTFGYFAKVRKTSKS